MVSKSFIKNVKRTRNTMSKPLNESSVLVNKCTNNPSYYNIETLIKEWSSFSMDKNSAFTLMVNELCSIVENNVISKRVQESIIENVSNNIQYLPENTLKSIKNKMYFSKSILKESAEEFSEKASDILTAIRVNENLKKIDEQCSLTEFCVNRTDLSSIVRHMVESYPNMDSKQLLNIMIESIQMTTDFEQEDIVIESIFNVRLKDKLLSESDVILSVQKSACINENMTNYIKSLYENESIIQEGIKSNLDDYGKKIIHKLKAQGEITKQSLQEALFAARKLTPEKAIPIIYTILYAVVYMFIYTKVTNFPITANISMIFSSITFSNLMPKVILMSYKLLTARIDEYTKRMKHMEDVKDIDKATKYKEVIHCLNVYKQQQEKNEIIKQYLKAKKKNIKESVFLQEYEDIDDSEFDDEDIPFEEMVCLVEAMATAINDISSLNEQDLSVLQEANSISHYVNIAKTKIQQSIRNASAKEKVICKTIDDAFDNALVSVQKSVTSDQREKVVKGRVLPALSKMIKYALTFGTAWVINPVMAIIGAIAANAVSKKATKNERKYVLDELEVQIKIVDRKINQAELLNEEEKLEQLYRLKRKLENEYNRIKYKLTVRHTMN